MRDVTHYSVMYKVERVRASSYLTFGADVTTFAVLPFCRMYQVAALLVYALHAVWPGLIAHLWSEQGARLEGDAVTMRKPRSARSNLRLLGGRLYGKPVTFS